MESFAESPRTSHNPRTTYLKPGVVIVLLFLVVGTGGFWAGRKLALRSNQPSPPPQTGAVPPQVQPTPSPSPTLTITSPTLSRLQGSRYNTPYQGLPDYSYLVWINDDGWRISVPGASSIGLRDENAYAALTDPTSQTVQIIEDIRFFMAEQNFTKNPTNSSTSFSDTTFYDYVESYTSNVELCSIKVNPDTSYYQAPNGTMQLDPTLYITCAYKEAFSAAEERQIPLLEALNQKKTTIYIDQITDRAAKVQYGGNRGGGFALFVKDDVGQWQVIFQGNDTPSCELLQEYNFPEEVQAC